MAADGERSRRSRALWLAALLAIALGGAALHFFSRATPSPVAPSPDAPKADAPARPASLLRPQMQAALAVQRKILQEIQQLRIDDPLEARLAQKAMPAPLPEASTMPEVDRQWLALSVHGHEAGELEPCACPNNPLGGLGRRATWTALVRSQVGGLQGVHVGGALCAQPGDGTEPEGLRQARAELYFAAWAHMGVRVLHAAIHELSIGLPELQRLARKHKIALVSSSLTWLPTSKATGNAARAQPLPAAVMLSLNGVRVGILGLASPLTTGKGPILLDKGLNFDDPIVAARRGVRAAQAQGAQIIVALTTLKRPELHRIAADVPEIHAFLGSEGAEQTTTLESVEHAVFADIHRQGKAGVALLLRPGAVAGVWQPLERAQALRAERASLHAIMAGFAVAPSEVAADAVRQEVQRMASRIEAIDALIRLGATFEAGAGAMALWTQPLDQTLASEPWTQSRVDRHLTLFPQSAGR